MAARQRVADIVDGLWEELHGQIVDGRLTREEVVEGLTWVNLVFLEEFEAWEAEADVNGQLS